MVAAATLWLLAISWTVNIAAFEIGAQDSECPDQSCLRCHFSSASQFECIKCRHFIVFESRECVSSCPLGYTPRWSDRVGYIGRVCAGNGSSWGGQTLAVVAGAAAGALCGLVAMLVCLILAARRRRYAALASTPIPSPCLEEDRRALIKRLAALRPEAPTLLSMLNEVRRHVRELAILHPAAADTYRPALCDLARVLQLLNMSETRLKAISLPNDWPSLLNRAERTLRRYQRRQAELPTAADAQLISFLQSSPTLPQPPTPRQPLTTFRPQESSTSPNLEASPLAEWPPSPWVTTGSSWTSCDDDHLLGLRPQDEITTEL